MRRMAQQNMVQMLRLQSRGRHPSSQQARRAAVLSSHDHLEGCTPCNCPRPGMLMGSDDVLDIFLGIAAGKGWHGDKSESL